MNSLIKISVSRYIGHVSYSFGSKVMVLAFLVAAILEICTFKYPSPPGNLGNFFKSLKGVF